jgi:hypothetical protein
MSAQMDPGMPSSLAANHILNTHTAARSSWEPTDRATQSPCPVRHSDRILAFLRKNPGQAEWFR